MMSDGRALKKSRGLRPAVGALFGLVAVYFVLRDLDYLQAAEAMGRVSLPWIAAAFLISFLTHAWKALRWRMLLQDKDTRYSFLRIQSYLLAGQLVNIFVPGRAGDIGRALFLGQQGAGRVFSLGTVVMEKVLDIVFFAALTILLVSRITLPDEISIQPGILLVFLLGPIILLAVLGLKWSWISRRVIEWPFPRRKDRRQAVQSGVQSIGKVLSVLKDPKRLLAVIILSALTWLTAWLTNEIVLNAFGLHLPPVVSLTLLVVLQVGISANLVPGTLGVFEYLCLLVLSRWAVPQEMAVAYGIVLHVVVLLPLLIGALTAWWLPPVKAESRPV